tara:strand:- start:260 stop:1819 length:1560 start_codon:yes stop_codon:yes gene_type:complete
MSILRYTASLDNTITNAFQENLTTRGTGSNMGASDILETFSIYGQASSTSVELARILIQFPLSKAIADRASGVLAGSGSVVWKLKLCNAPHFNTTPRSYDLKVSAVSAEWQEGIGLDMEEFSDLTKDNIGSNWYKRAGATGWTNIGGDYHANPSFTQTLDSGLEDLEVNVSDIVEQWLAGQKQNYGFGIRLTDSFEGFFSSSTGLNFTGSGDITGSNVKSDIGSIHNLNGATKSYYTKRFYGRGTEFFFKRPILEAQFKDSKRDDRSNFHFSSSLLPSSDNLNTIFFYNRFRGRLVDVAGQTYNLPTASFYFSSGSVPEGSPRNFRDSSNNVTSALKSTRVDTGIYKVQFSATSSIVTDNHPFLIDVWSFGGEQVFTGSVITPKTYRPETFENSTDFVISMTNLKPEYGKNDLVKLRLYAREKNWSPNIYTVAKNKPESKLIISGSYKVIRMIDELTVVNHGTGSLKYTELSYDQNGNYFEFNMNMLEPGYQYGFKFAIYDEYTKSYLEQPHIFKFRVS